MATTEPTLLEALTLSGGADGPGPALDAAHQIARRTGADHHDLLVVLGSGADGALEGWASPRRRCRCLTCPASWLRRPPATGTCSPPTGARCQATTATAACAFSSPTAARTCMRHGSAPVVALARAAAAAGVRAAVLVNANGCLRDWRLGEVMTITDHLNLTGSSPFDGTVFVDVREVWDRRLAQVLRKRTEREGTYAALRGPEYQTMAETRWLAGGGADAVGMSTVLEAIALHQLGVRVAGMSVVSDLSFAAEATDPEEVVRLVRGRTPPWPTAWMRWWPSSPGAERRTGPLPEARSQQSGVAGEDTGPLLPPPSSPGLACWAGRSRTPVPVPGGACPASLVPWHLRPALQRAPRPTPWAPSRSPLTVTGARRRSVP